MTSRSTFTACPDPKFNEAYNASERKRPGSPRSPVRSTALELLMPHRFFVLELSPAISQAIHID